MGTKRNTKLAVAIASMVSAAAMSGVATNAHAYAYAQAEINLKNFLLTLTNITVNGASNTAQINGALDPLVGFNNSQTAVIPGSAGTVAVTNCSGAGGGNNCGGAYTATPLTQPSAPTGRFAGATSSLAGNAIAGGATITTDATASIADPTGGNANAGSALNNNANFTIAVGAGGGTIVLTFDASTFQRAALSQPQINAASVIAQSFQISRSGGGGQVLLWTPDGIAGDTCDSGSGLVGFSCVINSNPFDLNNTVNETFTIGDTQVSNKTVGYGGAAPQFMITVNLPAGNYNFGAGTQLTVNAQYQSIAEPGSLALLGASLAGFGLFGRRKAKKAA